MPIFEYKCKSCGMIFEEIDHRYRPKKWVRCKCGGRMNRVYSRVNTDLVDRPRWSSAMGVNISQIPQARRLWPDEKFNEKGDVLIRNRKHKLKFMKKRNPHLVELD
jgi:putative FmdB family regulatory protein